MKYLIPVDVLYKCICNYTPPKYVYVLGPSLRIPGWVYCSGTPLYRVYIPNEDITLDTMLCYWLSYVFPFVVSLFLPSTHVLPQNITSKMGQLKCVYYVDKTYACVSSQTHWLRCNRFSLSHAYWFASPCNSTEMVIGGYKNQSIIDCRLRWSLPTGTLRPRQNGRQFTDIFKCIFGMITVVFRFKFH